MQTFSGTPGESVAQHEQVREQREEEEVMLHNLMKSRWLRSEKSSVHVYMCVWPDMKQGEHLWEVLVN